jgi:hypothetical protein
MTSLSSDVTGILNNFVSCVLFCVNLKPRRVPSVYESRERHFLMHLLTLSSCSASDFIYYVTVFSTISFIMAITFIYPTLQYPSSVRTWSVAAPVRAGAECDLKTLLCSFSFKASALIGNGAVVTGNFTTAEQRVSRVNSAASSSSSASSSS